MELLPKNCPECGVEFVCKGKQQHERQIFCSRRKCWRVERARAREKAHAATCSQCGVTYQANNPNTKRALLCSKDCYYASRVGRRTCLACGVVFETSRRNQGETCSKGCANTYRSLKSGRPKTRKCIGCGIVFEVEVASKMQEFCNRVCWRQNSSKGTPGGVAAEDLSGRRFGLLVALSRATDGSWMCLCDCGTQTMAAGGDLTRGRYSSCGCRKRLRGPNRKGRWIGGRTRTNFGYIHIWAPHHPYADGHGRVPEHRLVMETIIGRPVAPKETVHHKNGVRDDNRPENLELWTKSHLVGVRVSDLTEFCLEHLRKYAPDSLVPEVRHLPPPLPPAARLAQAHKPAATT